MGRHTTRFSGKLISTAGVSYRKLAQLQKGVSAPTLQRITTAPWSFPRPENRAVEALFTKVIPTELAHDAGERVSKGDTRLSSRWLDFFRGRIEQDLLERLDDQAALKAHLVRMRHIVDEVLAHPRPSSLMHVVVQTAALTHCAENEPDKSLQGDYRQRAEALIETYVIGSIADDYAGYDPLELIPSASNPDERPWLECACADLTGVLLGSCLEYAGQLANRTGGSTGWRQFVSNLEKRGLLTSLIVRGMVCAEPDALLNSAEALFVVGQLAASEALIRHARHIEPAAISTTIQHLADYYDPAFIAFTRIPEIRT